MCLSSPIAALAVLAAMAAGCGPCGGEPANIATGAATANVTAEPTAAPPGSASRGSKIAPLSGASTGRPDFDALGKPHATLTDVHVEGALDATKARAAIVPQLPAADACFARRLAEKPGLRGTVEVRVVFPGAAVTATHTGADLALTECIGAAFATWPENVGAKGVLLFRLSLYRGLELPTTMPSLPPPPTLPRGAKGAAP